MRHTMFHRSKVQRGHRVASACKAYKLPGRREFRGCFGDFGCTIIEGLILEGPERTVPD